LDTAIDFARATGASIEVVHVVEEPIATVGGAHAYAFDVPELRGELLKMAEQALTDIQKAHEGVPLATRALVGYAARTIVEIATDEQVDLIVLGSHGRHALTRMLMGSVAERVVRLAPCAVLTVKARLSTEPATVREAAAVVSS
jgi:nucleotide-binding universal stress UspA family protein